MTAHAEKLLLEQYKVSSKYHVLESESGILYWVKKKPHMNQDSMPGVPGTSRSLKELELLH